MVKEFNQKEEAECEWKLILSQKENYIKGFANFSANNFCKVLSQTEIDFIGKFTIEAQAEIEDNYNINNNIHFNLTWRSNRKEDKDQITSMVVKLCEDKQMFVGTWQNYSSSGKCEGKRIV